MHTLTRPRRRVTAALALAATAALALTACSPTASETSPGSASVDHGEISVQYSWIKNEEFAGEYYAYDNGYYDEAGFSAVQGIAGPDTGVAKLLSGSVQFALSDAASVGAAVAEQDAPLKIVATTFQKNPFTVLSLTDKGNIATPQDLIGKKIGVQDSNASVFKALLAANDIDEDQVTVVPVDFDPTPLMNGEVDGFMAYLTNEAITVEMEGYEVTNLAYADNGLPYVAEAITVTQQYLDENPDLVKAFLIAEIKGWTDTFTQPTDDTVTKVTEHYNASAAAGDLTFGELDPAKVKAGLEAQAALISTPETEANGLFTISDELKAQSIASLAAAGWELEVDDLFDTTILDEIYTENPELKNYQP
ncbi:twin-arginine translocation pathway signal protein [Pseudoclavibacter sp. RFBG4]|uniref:ABC transporter substrate-binding protein n=1 Tax=unclassified Pseudoclavibacter TaxID=2615177 RepID=UPI000CE7DD64|nr:MULTISPECIES: ABC transporter substrate-binding protein [unclassified Pseudoclavibacter]MBF4460776.1 ABC transporter substrate-binding protein [Pseudoclavibacter sp. VKM Ac-2867]PPF72334.1 twin-arginine translocation pathway signal protein [Pseudoclavibacter sp. Z016]PPG26548.1 twin-arginine translocation pathway signal protein [Pseudoclavibacter sp. RFBG4]VXC00496.1 Twin-arginine translocation pathway signal protein [Pseudoclavibacter sp. 8L]